MLCEKPCGGNSGWSVSLQTVAEASRLQYSRVRARRPDDELRRDATATFKRLLHNPELSTSSKRVFMFEVRRFRLVLFVDLDDFSIVHVGDAVGIGKNPVVVGDDDDRAFG